MLSASKVLRNYSLFIKERGRENKSNFNMHINNYLYEYNTTAEDLTIRIWILRLYP